MGILPRKAFGTSHSVTPWALNCCSTRRWGCKLHQAWRCTMEQRIVLAMTTKYRLRIVITMIVALLLVSGYGFAQMMGGKQVRDYTGSVNMLNERDGKIIIKIDDGSTGNWSVGRYTVVLRGSEREPLSLLLSSKRVKVWVAQDGTVQRVEILQM